MDGMIPDQNQNKQASNHRSSQSQSKSQASQKMSRRRFLIGMMSGLVIPPLAGAYARWIEPVFVRDRKITLISPSLPTAFNGIRIAHLSDIHFGDHFDEGAVQHVVENVMALEPDLICLTGDMVDTHTVDPERLTPILRQLRAPLGCFAVFGNHDYRSGIDRVAAAIEQGGITILKNGHHILHKNGEAIALLGIDDALEGYPDMDAALDGIPEGMWSLLLAHEPDWADQAVHAAVDVQLSGHSHGGQVRIPFVGPVFLPLLGKIYPDGYYQLERSTGTEAPLLLYTSRGLGTTMLPIRFACPPEWTLITMMNHSIE